MTISMAIRLGAHAVRENPWIYIANIGPHYQGCALGTAAYAVGVREIGGLLDFVGMLNIRLETGCPLAGLMATHYCPWGRRKQGVGSLIQHLHYFHRWPRLTIADWLEQHPDLDLDVTTDAQVKAPHQPLNSEPVTIGAAVGL